jgi:hypothetical protein
LQHYHILLIRDPLEVLTSWNAIGSQVHGGGGTMTTTTSTTSTTTTTDHLPPHLTTTYEMGIVPLYHIYLSIAEEQQQRRDQNHHHHHPVCAVVVVVDAEELVVDPETTLRRLCHKFQISYSDSMYVPGGRIS